MFNIDPRGRPQSRPVVITIFTQSVRQSVRPSVRPSQNFKIKRQSLPARDCGLAEWIIDDSCLVQVHNFVSDTEIIRYVKRFKEFFFSLGTNKLSFQLRLSLIRNL